MKMFDHCELSQACSFPVFALILRLYFMVCVDLNDCLDLFVH